MEFCVEFYIVLILKNVEFYISFTLPMKVEFCVEFYIVLILTNVEFDISFTLPM